MANIPLDKLAKTLGGTLDETARAFTIGLFNGVIQDTRVDTGRLRGAWATTVGAPASQSPERLDPNGTAAQADVQNKVKSGEVMYITNTLPYAPVYNQKDGIIDKNIARIDRNIREAVRK